MAVVNAQESEFGLQILKARKLNIYLVINTYEKWLYKHYFGETTYLLAPTLHHTVAIYKSSCIVNVIFFLA